MKTDLISIDDLSKKRLLDFITGAERMETMSDEDKRKILVGKILAVMFFEPSTRTRLSFEAAMLRLGGANIGFSETGGTSVSKGETLRDTVRTIECYADAMVIRHPREGAARAAAEISHVPIINAGDGANQHPTQTLLDLYTIKKFFGRLDNLNIVMAGDLKYSRTVHSLVQALAHFEGIKFTFVSPDALRLPGENRKVIPDASFSETDDLATSVKGSDVIYMTRIQRERFADPIEYEKVKDFFCIDARMLKNAAPHLKVLHPLPRVNEIHPEVDSTQHAGYFEQARNGLIMRQAILASLLGGEARQ
ncbi:MAG: aspartate carbamoyltransferase [Candidatus Ozemobacteraceae bacterium]